MLTSDVHRILGIDEQFKAPTRIMQILWDREERERAKYRKWKAWYEEHKKQQREAKKAERAKRKEANDETICS